MKALIVNGSHRKGNTDIAIQKLKKVLEKRACEVGVLTLRDIEMKLPDGCEVCAESGICPNVKDQFSEEIEPTLRGYDFYVLATPTWSDNVTPLTKIFWDRIVSWCDEKKMYLRGKKLAILTHGMAGKDSWDNVVNWVKSICEWEECKFAGALTFKSGGKVGDLDLGMPRIEDFVNNLLNQSPG